MQKYDNTTKRQIKVEDLTIEKYRLDYSHTATIVMKCLQVVQLTSSVSKVKMDQEELGAKVSSTNKKSALDLDNDDFLTGTSSVKTEIASLSSQVGSRLAKVHCLYCSQVFTLKTTVFELSTDFTGVRNS